MLNHSAERWVAALYAAIAAGIVATVAQIVLWWAFWDVLPSILYRDIQFTAAIVLGKEVLPPPAVLDWQLALIATGIHFALAIVYTAVLCNMIHGLDTQYSLIVGGLFGMGIFIVNMYGFVHIFPWFVETRDWITATAHLVFGISAAGVYKGLSR